MVSNSIDVSPGKDVGSSKSGKKKQKKKLLDMLGPRWSKEELEQFYESYRKYGNDWGRVAAALPNRSTEMVKALYNINKAYLSLPEGMVSVVGLIAMMTDHYNVLMRQTKTLALKKSKRSRIGDSTSSAKLPKPPNHLTDAQEKKLIALSKKPMFPNMYIDWELLDYYGLSQKVRDLCATGPWERLFSIREKVYQKLTLEFMATLKFDQPLETHGLSNSLEFTVNGELQRISMATFCVKSGLYDEEEVDSNDFCQLNHALPHGASHTSLWREWSNDSKSYCASVSKGSNLKKPEWRVIHWLLSHSLTGRGQSNGVVNAQDMLYLYSILKKFPLNIGVQLAFYIKRQAQDGRVGNISCGAFITHLLKNLGLFPNPPPADEITASIPLTGSPFGKWNFEAVVHGVDETEDGQGQPSDATTTNTSFVPLSVHLQMIQDYITACFTALGLHLNVEMPPFPNVEDYWNPQGHVRAPKEPHQSAGVHD